MPKHPTKPWTADDDALMRQHYPHTLTPAMAAMLGRRIASIHARADRLGLKKTAEHKRNIVRDTTRQRSPWNEQLEELMALLYPHAMPGQMQALLGIGHTAIASKAQSMGLKKTPETLTKISRASNEKRRAADEEAYFRSKFQPGLVPWNKGKKTGVGGGSTSYTKGNAPSTTLPLGASRWRASHNNILIKVAQPNIWRLAHHIAWEQAHGKPLPPGHVVRFNDGNPSNLHPDNLTAISRTKLSSITSPMFNGALHPQLRHLITLRGALTRAINTASKK